MRLPPAIRDLFRTEDDPGILLDSAAAADMPAAPEAGAPVRPRPGPSETARLERFESRLRTLAETGERSGPLIAGRLQIIALSRVKERLGEDWARLAAKIHRLTKRILERRLTDADVYVRVGDRYVILFASLTAIEATFKAQAIAREITALLIGELPEIDETPVRVTIHEIDPGELKGGPSLGALVAQLDHLAAREADKDQDRGPGSPEIADHGPAPFEFLPSGAGGAGRWSAISAPAGAAAAAPTRSLMSSTPWRCGRSSRACRRSSAMAMRRWWWPRSAGTRSCSSSAGRPTSSSAGRCRTSCSGGSGSRSRTSLPAPGAA
jgi:hypothetical protein